MTAKICVIDDEPTLGRLYQRTLSEAGFEVAVAQTGKSGIQLIKDTRPDLVILDMGLPDMDGLAVLATARRHYTGAVVVVSVLDDQSRIVTALDTSADDYITKPFGIPELLARIRLALRHRYAPSQSSAVLTAGPLVIDIATRLVTVNGTPIKLTGTEYDLLKLLVRHTGKIVTYPQIITEIWGETATDSSHYVRIYLSQLRKRFAGYPEIVAAFYVTAGVGVRFEVGGG